MWPILKIDARTQTEAAPGEQTEMRCRSANQSLITDVLALRPYFCTIQLQSIRTAQAVWCQITAPRALDGGHQILLKVHGVNPDRAPRAGTTGDRGAPRRWRG